MIKPVKRNKRLKWVDSRYAKRFLKPKLAIKVCTKPFKKSMRKAITAINRFSEAMNGFNEDVCNIEDFNCVVKGRVTK